MRIRGLSVRRGDIVSRPPEFHGANTIDLTLEIETHVDREWAVEMMAKQFQGREVVVVDITDERG